MTATDLIERPDRIDDDASRRQFLIGGLSAAALLPGCSDSDSASSASSGRDGFPVKIEHKYGGTEIPAEPDRVVTVGFVEQDPLLALGVVPVATTEWFGEHPGAIHPWARAALGDAAIPEVLTTTDGIQMERIAALKPDLILALIGADVSPSDYDKLARIAPTMVQPAGVPSFGMSWQDITRTVGRAVGQPGRAAQRVADLEARFVKTRAEHPEFPASVATMAATGENGNFYAYPPPDAGGRLLADLGFQVPAEIRRLAGDQALADISGERLDLLDTDVLVWLVTASQRDEVLANGLYRTLDVHTQGRDVFLVDEEDILYGAASSFQGVLSLPILLDKLVPRLAAAVDGDLATVTTP